MLKLDQPKRGILTTNDVRLKAREWETVDFLLVHGEDIELLVPGYTKGNKYADFVMRGKVWEMKVPTSTNVNTLTVMLKRAMRQSTNLVIDLRFMKDGSEEKVLRLLENKMLVSRQAKEFLVITKAGKILTMNKKTCKK